MQKIILYAAVLLCTLVTQMYGQETFDERAKNISENIKKITNQEKEALKQEVEDINKLVENGTITAEKADAEKLKAAQVRAKNIEEKVAVEEAKLQELVKDAVDGKINYSKEKEKWGTTIILGSNSNDSIGENHTEISIGSMKVYKGEKDKFKRNSKRTTSQFVFAFGLNNLVTDGDTGSLEDSDYRVWGSHFYEWGVTYNTRIFKNNNLLHAKYGLSLMYNNLRPTDNRYFAKNGEQTNLEEFDLNLKESRFRNVSLVLPLHLEFDFTPKSVKENGDTRFRTHKSVRLGIGGYAGFNIKSKQILKFNEDDVRVKVKEKGDFNTSDFTYGLSTYIGYRATSLYLKYDLNPMFKNNTVEQNNISLGLRFDFN
ncbi:ATP synthase subunit B family protein [Flavobacterium lacus]|uniref:Outer membrane protein with beta-barrel domain n=1 Tax=Flavobacterium lacus TaxID=1353778 RepID=A0A328WRR9_9FLAO|nr:hypothetical protein [Flavobacterium lacus]RAR47826.1 hypothetical protein B0I10_107103 [Flavobacterium lacus]